MKYTSVLALAGLLIPLLASDPALASAALLVPTGSVWRYLDNNSNLGTAWRERGFNDSAWPAGAAQLGYGDGDEATVINGGPVGARFITTYLRREFAVTAAFNVQTLTLRLLRDDGAVVYLNGVEVYRDNMPGGLITFQTFASTTINGAAESTFITANIDPSRLVEGTNILAVEVHQAAPNSSDVSFDAELVAIPVDGPPSIVAPPQNQTVFEGETAQFTVTAQGTAPILFQWFANAVAIKSATNATLVLTDVTTNQIGSYFVEVSNPLGTGTSAAAFLNVLRSPPVITAQPQDRTVAPGQPVTFSVTATGSQPLRYQWRFEETPLPDGTNATLFLAGVGLTNAGAYSVAISNALGGIVSSPATLKVVANVLTTINFDDFTAPCVFVDTRPLTNRYEAEGVLFEGPGVLDGGAVVNECGGWSVTGHSRPNFMGFNSTGNFTGGGVPRGPETIRFTRPMSQVRLRAGGSGLLSLVAYGDNFQVAATNVAIGADLTTVEVAGTAITRAVVSCTASAFVIDDLQFRSGPAPIEILSQPISVITFAGRNVTFTVAANGAPPLRYQWDFNGADIPDATNATLTLASVGATDEGSYRVTVSNASESVVSSKANLTLRPGGAPTVLLIWDVLEEGTAALRTALENAGIIVTLSETSETSYLGTNPAPDDFSAVIHLNGVTYGTEMPFAGQDTLVRYVQQGGGYLHSEWNTFEIFGGHMQRMRDLVLFDRVDGREMPITYTAVPEELGHLILGNVPSTFVFQGGVNNGKAHAFAVDPVTVLMRDNTNDAVAVREFGPGRIVGFSHAGNYNHASYRTLMNSNIQQLYIDGVFWAAGFGATNPPTISIQPTDQTDFIGAISRFDVVARGARPLVYQWRFEGTVLPGETNAVLLLGPLTPLQAGGYSVVVSNAFGSVTSTAAVLTVVDAAPEITMQPRNRSTLIGANVQFSASAVGSLPFAYQWEFNGAPLAGATNAVLSLSGVNTNDAGSYRVTVRNALGATTSSNAILQVRVAPLVAVFDDPRFVDTLADPPGAESDNVQASLRQLGFPVTTFTNILAALSSNSVVVFPEFEIDNLTPTLDLNTRQALREFVAGGGLMIVQGGAYNVEFMSSIFALPVTIIDDGSTGAFVKTANASGTAFEDDSETLPTNDSTTRLALASLPPQTGIYTTGDAAAVALIPYGNGRIAYLGWDWWDAAPIGGNDGGWLEVLASAGQESGPLPPTAPRILLGPESKTVRSGTEVTFAVITAGTPPLRYQWEFNGTGIADATNSTLTLVNVGTNNSGNYRVVVSNPLGDATTSAAVLNVVEVMVEPFYIVNLTTNLARAVEHITTTGDDRGGIAASFSRVFYSGDEATGGFNLADLSNPIRVNQLYDSMTGDLKTGKIYVLADESGPLGQGGIASGVIELDGETGVLTTNRIDLTTPIDFQNSNGEVGIFAGYGRIVLRVDRRIFSIFLPSGIVEETGTTPPFLHAGAESWAYWGVAEYFSDAIWLVYVRDSQHIVRTRVPDGLTLSVAEFENLSDMASITVSLPLNRWYFHHEGISEFHSGDETIGYAKAAFAYSSDPRPPTIVLHPRSRFAREGRTAEFEVVAAGNPLAFQWRFNGADIAGATNRTLVLTGVTTNQAGNYSVVVGNELGSVTSSNALLTIITSGGANGRVAILGAPGDPSWAEDVRAKLTNTLFFDTVDHYQANDPGQIVTLDDLLQYGAVLVYSDAGFVDPTALGNLLADYADQGGGVVVATFALTDSLNALAGRFITEGYLPFTDGGPFADPGLTLVPDLPDHPILTGVDSFNGGSSGYRNPTLALAPDATLVAHYVGGDPLVGVKEASSWRVVGLNFFPPSTDVRNDFWEASTDGALLMANSLLWASQSSGSTAPPTIRTEPASRTALVGLSASFSVGVVGAPPFSYQWLFNDAPLTGATNRTLVLTNLALNQSGPYRVRVSNGFGAVTSQVATLTVREPRGVIGYFTDYNSTSTGAVASIERAGFTARHIENLANADLSDLAMLLINELGSPMSAELDLRLPEIERWVSSGGKVIVHDESPNPGRTAVHPLVLGLPTASITGEFGTDNNILPPGNTLVTTGPHGTLNNSSLDGATFTYSGYASAETLSPHATRILNAGSEPDRVTAFGYGLGAGFVYFSTVPLGFYFDTPEPLSGVMRSVYAPNVIEYAFAYAATGSPQIFAPPANASALSGGSVSFTVGATGMAPLQYQWIFNGSALAGATNATLVLTGVSTNQAGNYRVTVTNPLGNSTTADAILSLIEAKIFKIVNLLTNTSRVVDHDAVTGDDDGGIAVSTTSVFYTGNNGTGRFSASDLSGGTRLSTFYAALVSNLRTETVYTLADGVNPLGYGGTVTALIQIDSATGLPTTNRVNLSQPVTLGGGSGIFAGYDAIVLYDGTHVFRVELPSGFVSDLGAVPFFDHSFCESWAFWGVAEYFRGAVHLVYVRDYQTIARLRVPDGLPETVATFANLSDMCSFTFSLSRNRWYFHHEGGSQFGGTIETLGYASGNWDRPPVIGQVVNNTVAGEDQPGPPIQFAVLDEGNPTNVTVSVQVSNPVLVPPSNILLSNLGTARFLVLRPATNQFGTSVVTITAMDLVGNVTNRSFTFVVNPVNDPPAFTAGPGQSLREDAEAQSVPNWATAISAGPTNEAGQSLVFQVSNDNPGMFAVAPSISPDGRLDYALAPNGNGEANVTVQLRDSGGTSDGGMDLSPPVTFRINATAVNDPPAFTLGPPPAVPEDSGPQTLANWASGVSAGPPDEAGQVVSFQISNNNPALFAAQPAITPNGTLTFTPAANAYGSAVIRAQLRDNGGTANGGADTSPDQTFTITVQPVNDRPVANSQSIALAEDATVTITLTGSDVDGNPLTYTILTQPSHGTLTGPGTSPNYRPAANYFGSDSFTFKVNDGVVDSEVATVAITVLPVDDSPVAYSQMVTNLEDRPIAILLGGADVDNDPLAYFSTSPAHGTLIGPDPNLTYRPETNYAGPDSFRFRVLAAGVYSDFVSVSIVVLPVNDPPTFTKGPGVTVSEDAGARSIANWATNIAPGPTNESGQTVAFTVSHNNPSLFSAPPAISPGGTLSFTPAANANGTALVTALLQDNGGTANGGQNTSAPQTFTITVQPVNDAPTANAQSVQLDEDGSAPIVLNGSDIEAGTLTYLVLALPAHGKLTGSGATRTYIPAADYNGPDSFTFKVNDGAADSAPATVSIAVRAINDAPVASAKVVGLTYLGSRDTNGVIISPNGTNALVVFDASLSYDVEGDPLVYSWFESSAPTPFATGVLASNVLEVGGHEIVLYVDDGDKAGRQAIIVETISPAMAVDELLATLNESTLARNHKRPLSVTLTSAASLLEEGSLGAAINQLRTFQNKVVAQVKPVDPALAAELLRQSQIILSAIAGR